MKLIFKQLAFGLVLIVSGLMISQQCVADDGSEGYGSSSIVSIDKKKKIIDFGDYKFKYDDNTIVYDLYGKKVDFKLLKPGMSANIKFDPAKRFVGYPTLKQLLLKSVIE